MVPISIQSEQWLISDTNTPQARYFHSIAPEELIGPISTSVVVTHLSELAAPEYLVYDVDHASLIVVGGSWCKVIKRDPEVTAGLAIVDVPYSYSEVPDELVLPYSDLEAEKYMRGILRLKSMIKAAQALGVQPK